MNQTPCICIDTDKLLLWLDSAGITYWLDRLMIVFLVIVVAIVIFRLFRAALSAVRPALRKIHGICFPELN